MMADSMFLESYTFDQEVARRELSNMLVLHEYPLSIVDHAGFRKFVHALQPLFKLPLDQTYSSPKKRYRPP